MEGNQFIIDYYETKDHKHFYKTLWGGESIHIGIYDCYNMSDDKGDHGDHGEITPEITPWITP